MPGPANASTATSPNLGAPGDAETVAQMRRHWATASGHAEPGLPEEATGVFRRCPSPQDRGIAGRFGATQLHPGHLRLDIRRLILGDVRASLGRFSW